MGVDLEGFLISLRYTRVALLPPLRSTPSEPFGKVHSYRCFSRFVLRIDRVSIYQLGVGPAGRLNSAWGSHNGETCPRTLLQRVSM